MVISINVYDLVNSTESQPQQLDAFTNEEIQRINDFDENLTTVLTKNSLTQNGYRNFSILTDNVYNQNVRIRGEYVHSVIMQDIYQAYYKENVQAPALGALVTLCKTDDAERVRRILSNKFNMQFEQHAFDILKIIAEATDVRTAKFNVKIETVNSISMKGTRVNDTAYYSNMLRKGDLRAVLVTFDMPEQSVTFRISVDGKILLYSQLNDSEILNLVDQLLEI